jgi:uncharacterized membrane protein YcjF (UPF0283 family)
MVLLQMLSVPIVGAMEHFQAQTLRCMYTMTVRLHFFCSARLIYIVSEHAHVCCERLSISRLRAKSRGKTQATSATSPDQLKKASQAPAMLASALSSDSSALLSTKLVFLKLGPVQINVARSALVF